LYDCARNFNIGSKIRSNNINKKKENRATLFFKTLVFSELLCYNRLKGCIFMSYKATAKLYQNNKFIGCNIIDTNSGKEFFANRAQLTQIPLENAKITKDLRLLCSDNIRKIYANKLITLYHGSRTGLSGAINPNFSREICDFGQGFYTGDNRQQAKLIAAEGTNPHIYDLQADLSSLSVYRFTDQILWMLYVAVKRGKIDSTPYRRLNNLIAQIDRHDVIVGLIADDRMTFVFERFIEGTLTDIALIKALQFVKLGNQYVFKNEKACNNITITTAQSIPADEIAALRKERRCTIGPLVQQIDAICKENRRNGSFMDELLKRWN